MGAKEAGALEAAGRIRRTQHEIRQGAWFVQVEELVHGAWGVQAGALHRARGAAVGRRAARPSVIHCTGPAGLRWPAFRACCTGAAKCAAPGAACAGRGCAAAAACAFDAAAAAPAAAAAAAATAGALAAMAAVMQTGHTMALLGCCCCGAHEGQARRAWLVGAAGTSQVRPCTPAGRWYAAAAAPAH